jgi:hypothetical protein
VHLLLLIIHNFDIVRVAVLPSKANSPSIIDTDAILSLPIPFQRFQLIAGRLPQILKGFGAIQVEKFASCLPFEGLKTANWAIIKESGGVAASERFDHLGRIVRLT